METSTIFYISTRGGVPPASFENVLLTGLAGDGGLFVPQAWPRLDPATLASWHGLSYAETTARVLAPFAEGALDEDEILAMARAAYDGFGHAATAPLVQIGDEDWLLELFHGPTLAFKDFALQLLGRLFEHVLARHDNSITIVGATSGDTGSAAIAAIAGRARMRVVILHPEGRVSEVQRRQMTTATAANVANVAINGTFDDCQALVKALFADEAFRGEQRLAAINSINWVRIAAQAAYYVHAALRLGAPERPVAFAVPTGNFGDVYAGHAAARLGLPVARLIVATNRNDILARFLATGRYEAQPVTATISPSMDIQVASNFERLLLELLDGDGAKVRELLARFADDRAFSVDESRLARARARFAGESVDEATTRATMRDVLERTGELVDPHTAVGLAAAGRAREHGLIGRDVPLITLATAHPAKFPDVVEEAAGRRPELPAHMADLHQRDERYHVLDDDLDALKAHIRALPREDG